MFWFCFPILFIDKYIIEQTCDIILQNIKKFQKILEIFIIVWYNYKVLHYYNLEEVLYNEYF